MLESLHPGYLERDKRISPILRWLRTPYATSTILASVFLANNFLTGFLFSGSSLAQDPAINVHLSDFLVGASGAVALMLLKGWFHVQADGLYRYRQVAAIWIMASVIASAITLTAERFLSGQPLKAVRITGIPYGIESYFAQFALFTILIAGISEMRKASTNLAIARHKLQEIQRNLSSQLKAQRAELETQIASQIDPVLAELQTVVSALNDASHGGTEIAIPKLKSAIDEVVRPLSHSLAMKTSEDREFAKESNSTVVQLRKDISRMSSRDRWWSRIPLGASFDPILGLLAFLLFVMPSIGYLDSISSALLICIPAILAIALSLLGLKRVLSHLELPYLVANALGVAANSALTVFFIAATKIAPNELPPAVITALAIGVGLVLAISGYFGLVIERRMRFLAQAHDTNLEVSEQLSRVRHEIVVLKRQIGRLIHGGVQARLQAAMLRLARVTEIDENLVSEVAADIDDARKMLERIDAPVPTSLGELLDEVIDFWAGVCDVNVETSRKFDERVSKDPIAVQCVIEIIREAITNAVKHGKASEVSVNLAFINERSLSIQVIHEEAREVELAKITPGLGSHIYDELSNRWALSKNGKTVTFEAVVGIAF